MTNEQAAWLKANPEYEIVPPGGASAGSGANAPAMAADRYSWLQALAPDGTVSKVKAEPPSILVGKRKVPGARPGGPLR